MGNSEFNRGDVVHVTWVDSVVAHGWVIPATSPLTHESVGKLYAELGDRYIITTSIDHVGQALSPLHIPKEAVKSIRIL